MKETFAIVGSIVAAVSFLPYLIQIIKNKVKPRIASWITWSLVTGISTIAAIAAHAYISALLTGAATFVEVSVLVFALRNGERTYGWIDGLSQVISGIGIIAWLLSKNPAAAIGFSILADICAAIPTLYHSWITPFEEAWQSFVVFGFGSLLTIFGITTFNFDNVAFPIYLTIIATSIGATILFRQRMIHSKTDN